MLYSYHDICEALGREPNASLRQTLYRARNGDTRNRALPWLDPDIHYVLRWGRIVYTQAGRDAILTRMARE